jgi:hypothetical protein
MKVIPGGHRRRIAKLKNALIYPDQTAAVLLSLGQKILGVIILGLAAAMTAIYGFHLLLVAISTLITMFFVVYVGLMVVFWWASTRYRYPDYQVPDVNDQTIPKCSALVTLKGEGEVAKHLVNAIRELQYPAGKLEAILVLEDKTVDPSTWEALEEVIDVYDTHGLFKVIGVPRELELPQNKPRALICGQTHIDPDSEYVVIYDAEDHPQPDQLLKAIGMFRAYEAQGKNVGCVQARLAFWNPRESFISVCYDAEYFKHFKWLLPGLVWLGLIPPLGGTSNIFRRDVLDAIAENNPDWTYALTGKHFAGSNVQPIRLKGAHDPHNITEDASIAFDMYKVTGTTIAMLDSVTHEEAQVSWRGARKQRSRWLQGYLQTFFAQTRRPIRTTRRLGRRGVAQYLCFNLLMVGAPLSYLLSPIVWGTMFLYVASRLAHIAAISGYIERLFPAPVYFLGMFAFLFGNFVLWLQALLTPIFQQEEAEAAPAVHKLTTSDKRAQILKANHDKEVYGLSFKLLFIPAFWMFTHLAADRAIRKLLTPSLRSHWDKTHHGHAREKLDQLHAAAELETSVETA